MRRTYWSPEPPPLTCGIPLPERRSRRLFCVPSGIVIATWPLIVGTFTSPPSSKIVNAYGKIDVEIVALALVCRIFVQTSRSNTGRRSGRR